MLIWSQFHAYLATYDLKPADYLALIAIIFAIVQSVDSWKAKRAMNGIAKSMSTRYIGSFPDSMSEIVDVVKQTDSSLCIMADTWSYGHYSQPIQFEAYLKKITEITLKQGKPVKMIVYTAAAQVQLRHQQFPETVFDAERRAQRYKEFYQANLHLKQAANWTEFNSQLAQEQARHLTTFKNAGVTIRELSSIALVSLWIEDKEDMVFAFHNDSDYEKEVAFRTRDGNLVSVLQGVFDHNWELADPIA